jgi:hypothetical protein
MNDCQLLFNTLKRIETPLVFIRELQETTACDHVKDYSMLRKKYSDLLGEETLYRIMNFKETLIDMRKAEQAFFRYYK